MGTNKGSFSKEASKFQPPSSLPPPVTGLLPIPNLKKKRKEQEVEEGVVRQEAKKQKMAQDKGRASSVESREDLGVAKVRHQHHTRALRLELDGATISWNSTIREF